MEREELEGFKVILPWPPSTNALHRAAGGTVHLQRRVEAWFGLAVEAVKRAPGYRVHLFPEGVLCSLNYMLVPPNEAVAGDLDNRDKATQDALARAQLVANDRQFREGFRVMLDPDRELAGVYLEARAVQNPEYDPRHWVAVRHWPGTPRPVDAFAEQVAGLDEPWLDA